MTELSRPSPTQILVQEPEIELKENDNSCIYWNLAGFTNREFRMAYHVFRVSVPSLAIILHIAEKI